MTWEYIAGFFDGEGTLAIRSEDNEYRVQIPQTNYRVLNSIRRFTGVGLICKVTKRKPHWKDSWVYYIAKQKDIYSFLTHVTPFLVVKREQVMRVIPNLDRILFLQQKRKDKLLERQKEALQLRKQGLSYWRIGLAMDLDRGYVRRLIVGKWRN